MNDLPTIDWKGDGGVVAAALALVGVLRRFATPWAAKQFAELLEPKFQAMAEQHKEIREEQGRVRQELIEVNGRAAHELAAMAERVASIEGSLAAAGVLERRRHPRG